MGIQFTGMASGLDTDNIIKELMKAERMKVEKLEKEQTKLKWKKDIWDEMNAKLYSFYTKNVFKLKSQGTFMQKNAVSSNENLVSAKTTASSITGSHTITINQLAKGSFLTGDELTTDRNSADITSSTVAGDLIDFGGASEKIIKVSIDNGTNYSQDISILSTDTITDISNKIKEKVGDINISFDSNFNRLMMSTKAQGLGKQIMIDGDDSLLTSLGLSPVNRTGTVGQDAEFVYNSTTLTSSSNEVNLNGMTLAFKGEGQTAIITVNQDNDAIYDSVKEFVTEYNKLLVEINGKIYADKAKGYEPLTEEEKKSMSEDEIKLWENKIKDSLLRRDGILSSLKDSMRDIVTISSGVDTTGFEFTSITQLGIGTGLYTEKGLLHINGNEEDPLYAVKDNDLKKAIEDNPEKVSELLTAIGEKLYSTMQDKMKSTKLSSALTFFNDKQMTSDIDDYKDKIGDLEKRLIQVEQRYYRQYTAMEKAIQAMNSQSASLASMLGGGSQ